MTEGSKKKDKKVDSANVKTLEPAKLEAVNKAFGDLINACVRLSIKVAKCSCEFREKCDVYNQATKIADIVDKLQEMAEK